MFNDDTAVVVVGDVFDCSDVLTDKIGVVDVFNNGFGINDGATNRGGIDGNKFDRTFGKLGKFGVCLTCGPFDGCINCVLLIRLFFACCQKSDCCIWCEYWAAAAKI